MNKIAIKANMDSILEIEDLLRALTFKKQKNTPKIKKNDTPTYK